MNPIKAREMENDPIYIYSLGIVAMSACVANHITPEELVAYANKQYPTGISSDWSISNEAFKTGETNPCCCNKNPDTHKHYLLVC